MHQLKRISYRHRAVLDWMMRNPDRPLGQCAKELGYSQAWLSIVVNSDLFQEEFQRRRRGYEAEHDRVIRGKAMRLAQAGMDRMLTVVETEDPDNLCDPRFAKDATETALKALGYLGSAGGAGPVTVNVNQQQNNQNQVTAEDLAEAREIMAQINGGGEREVKSLPQPDGGGDGDA